MDDLTPPAPQPQPRPQPQPTPEQQPQPTSPLQPQQLATWQQQPVGPATEPLSPVPALAASPVPDPAAASAAAPAPAPRRRGPGWGGVVGLVAAGMILSSGATLGGVIAYDELFADEPAPTTASAPADGATASPVASASTAQDPDWTAIAEQLSPSAVSIQVATQGGTSQGTGIVLDADGTILTNEHVVSGGSRIQVTTSEGLSYEAELVGSDTSTDLAVIRLLSPPDDLVPATFADSSTVEVGAPVMALGTPLGLENTVTTGIVSAVDRPVTATGEDPSGSDTSYTSAIQTDAAINPGNSGGPLVDASGQVIGINSAIAGIPNSEGQAGSIGLGFAIPSNTAMLIAEQLLEDGSADHAYLGVTTTDGSATVGETTYRGAEVVALEPDAPAAAGDLRDGDLITRVDDTPVGSAAALTGVVRGLEVGSTHTLTVLREDELQTLEVTLGSRSA
ncbi:trypsin-like peptidase domain-containing protein [Brachybacterium sp. J144]|uniref:S1C family serine protease n=1 Tax=Brachybacterium sp. J144 TaxID=3116487 RepID=UPI002E78A0AD|nr:trypsin-like peptidase domain-containing protein [Brachybacterium sp. J144]MEE1651883.1 trypsin-like peptidase domain-containing protein [Brachybacterium sp. J144]